MNTHWKEVAVLVEDYGFFLRGDGDFVRYTDKNGQLYFSCNRKNNKFYDVYGNKMYNREFKEYIKELIVRLENLTAFF